MNVRESYSRAVEQEILLLGPFGDLKILLYICQIPTLSLQETEGASC